MRRLFTCALSAALFVSAGCGHQHEPAEPETATTSTEDAHVHPTEGPHGGELIELGDEEFHAELVHGADDADLEIYILDGAAKSAYPIEATEVVINLKQDGAPVQHRLEATPQKDDPAGKSSRFVAKDNKELSRAIDAEDSGPRLQVTIDGKAYSGKVEHDHDHAEHDHDHDH